MSRQVIGDAAAAALQVDGWIANDPHRGEEFLRTLTSKDLLADQPQW